MREVKARRQRSGLWRDGIYAHIRGGMCQRGSLSIERKCQQAPASLAGFYRSLQEGHPIEKEMAVRDAIQHISLAHFGGVTATRPGES
ncbi:MAG: hypothetical protein QM771_08270 [Nitrospira sp.]